MHSHIVSYIHECTHTHTCTHSDTCTFTYIVIIHTCIHTCKCSHVHNLICMVTIQTCAHTCKCVCTLSPTQSHSYALIPRHTHTHLKTLRCIHLHLFIVKPQKSFYHPPQSLQDMLRKHTPAISHRKILSAEVSLLGMSVYLPSLGCLPAARKILKDQVGEIHGKARKTCGKGL